MIAPSKSPVTLGYGVWGVADYTQANPHAGVDFAHSPDNKIYAPENGTITFVGTMGDCGQAIELTSGANKHRFCHTSQILVSNGMQVAKGTVIGIMGQTGLAYGVHLHWILWVNGNRVNGLNYVNEKGGEMPIPDENNYYWRYGQNLAGRIRGRQLSRAEFKTHIVGRTDLGAVEVLSDNPEADAYMALGQWAKANKAAIEKKLLDLQALVNSLSARPTKEEYALVQAQISNCVNELKILQSNKSEDTVLLEDTGSLIQRFINRLFKKG